MYVTSQFLHWLNISNGGTQRNLGNTFTYLVVFILRSPLLLLHGNFVSGSGLVKLLGISNLSICSLQTVTSSVNDIKGVRYALQLSVCVIYKNLSVAHLYSGSALSSWLVGWDIYYFGNDAILETNSQTSDPHPYLLSINQRKHLLWLFVL